MTIYLARHGQTDYNHTRRFQGQMDVPLNLTGRTQAKALAGRVASLGLAALWSSPLARAKETATIVSVEIGLPVLFDARLMETDTGVWTDRLYAELEAADPVGYQGFVTGDEGFAFEGGESYVEQGDRVMAALIEIAAGARPVLVVCHGMAMRLAMRRLGVETAAGIENTELVSLPL